MFTYIASSGEKNSPAFLLYPYSPELAPHNFYIFPKLKDQKYRNPLATHT